VTAPTCDLEPGQVQGIRVVGAAQQFAERPAIVWPRYWRAETVVPFKPADDVAASIRLWLRRRFAPEPENPNGVPGTSCTGR
jgi:hypothetical protein